MSGQSHNHFKMISWNVAGRAKCLPDQIQAILNLAPEVIALQEITLQTMTTFQEQLTKNSYQVISSFDLAENAQLLVGPRKYGELIASRWNLLPQAPEDFSIPWKERVLSVVVSSPWGDLELHTTHIPPGVSHHWIKIETLEGLFTRLACRSIRLRILCGDFNTPQMETQNGQIITWGQSIRQDGTYKTKKGYERWDRAERNVLVELAIYDLTDVFRRLYGYTVEEYSWYWRGKGGRIGRRFDHVFASKALRPVRCRYLHQFRENGLSDHSPIEVRFQPDEYQAG